MTSEIVDVTELIRADHDKVRVLFEALGQPGADDRDVLAQIVRALSVHATAEEAEVYPHVARVDEAEATRAREEHDAMKRLLVDLDGADPEADGVRDRIAELRDAVDAHVAEEERVLLPTLGAALGPAGLEELAVRFAAAKDAAPTHPHPHAPTNPVSSAVAGAFDRARDALRHRS